MPLPKREVQETPKERRDDSTTDPFSQLQGVQANEYLLKEVINAGGKSYIYEAINQNIMSKEIIKLLNEKTYKDTWRRNLFYFESRLGANLHKQFHHENIVGIRNAGVFSHDGKIIPYIVLEHDGGQSLIEYLAQGNTFAFKDISILMEDICAGTSFSHKNEIYNEDIELKNIRRTWNGRNIVYKISDYGRFNDQIKELFKGIINDLHISDIKSHIFNVENIYTHPKVSQEIRDQAFIHDLQGLGIIFKETLNASGQEITKPLELIIEQSQEPTKEKNFKDAEDISKAIRHYEFAKGRRRAIFIGAGLTAGLTAGLGGGIAINYLRSPLHTHDQLMKTKTIQDKRSVLKELATALADKKVTWLENEIIPPKKFPYATNGGKWFCIQNGNWTDGYWPGLLWTSYKLTGNEALKTAAERTTDNIIMLDDLQKETDSLRSFRFFHSHAQAYKTTGNPAAKSTALLGAAHLAARYNEQGGFIQSGGEIQEQQPFELRLDAARALPLLWFGYEAAEAQADKERFMHIITAHLKKTMQYSIRKDWSTREIAFFGKEPEKLVDEDIRYGLGKGGSHVVSQTQAIQAFIEAYDHTNEHIYIDTAQKLTKKILSVMDSTAEVPFDLIPSTYRDNSANILFAHALIDLYRATDSYNYYEQAINIMTRMATQDLALKNNHKEGIVLHCMKSKDLYPDASIIYADYGFLETIRKI